MKNQLNMLGRRFGGLASKLLFGAAVLAALIPLHEAKAIDGIIQTNHYETSSWNVDTIFRKEPNPSSEKVTNKVSKTTIIADNLQEGISNLKFYTAGTMNTNSILYEYSFPTFKPVQGVMLRNNHSSTWQIQAITNIGKNPNIFGLDKNLIFLEQNSDNTYTLRLDDNVRVFNRDIYEVSLGTSNGIPTNNFTLDIDLITDDANTTNDTETSTFGVLYDKIVLDNTTNYFGYINRVFGRMNDKLDISKDDEDGDGIANSWEATYFGGPTNADANADSDSDGINNKDEFAMGTNPLDKDSALIITNLEARTNTATLNWQGSLTNFFYEPINYSVDKATNLLEESPWTTIATNINDRVFTDTNATESAVYRIEVQP